MIYKHDEMILFQDKAIEYFMSTKEEKFFSLIKDHLQEATEIALER